MIPKGFHKFAIAQLEKAAMTPVKDELCANCGRPYREHLMDTTQCFEGQEGKWFPGSIAEAIVASRQQTPQVIYGTKGEIPEDLQSTLDMAKQHGISSTPMSGDSIAYLVYRIARAEGSLRQAGFTNSADGFLWIPPDNSTRVSEAFDMIAKANTVTFLSLDEMESVVNRALSGEFDRQITEREKDAG